MHLRFIFTCLLFFTFNLSAKEPSIQVVTEDAYPLQYLQNGQLTGPTTALVEAILSHAKLSYDIEVLPWARAYQEALTQKNMLIYSIARTKQRENEFQWIGSIFELDYYLVGLDSLPKPSTLDSIKHLRIGVIRNSGTYLYLKEQNFQNLHVLDRPEQVINMLKSGRIDLFPVNISVFKPLCTRLDIDCEGITVKVKLNQPSTSLYLALSKQSDEKLVQQLRVSYQHVMQ